MIVLLALPLAAADVSGKWKGEVEVAGNSATPEFTFKQDGARLTGAYKGMLGEAPIEGTVEGSRIRWVVKGNFDGSPVTVIYTGTLESDKLIKGTVDFAGQAEGTFTAKKE
jgi:carbon monoxide dehydrogenase subunit G